MTIVDAVDTLDTSEPVEVVLIVGSGRSGSTLLNRVLGQLDGCVAVGELRNIWGEGFGRDRLCGCGQRFWSCDFWSDVVQLLDANPREYGRRMLELQVLTSLNRHTAMIANSALRTRLYANRLDKYSNGLRRLLQAIRVVAGARYVIDASKHPAHGFVLAQTPGVSLRVIHLVRDPRGVAYSWSRPTPAPDQPTGFMPRYHPLYAAALWAAENLLATWLCGRLSEDRWLFITYEEFVRSPQEVTNRLAEWLGVPPPDGWSDREIFLKPSHTIAGNPSRFRTGRETIRTDDRWRSEMPLALQLGVKVLSGPVEIVVRGRPRYLGVT